MSFDFFDALQKRRSQYFITDKVDISQDEIIELIGYCIKNAPSAFNNQGSRIVVLFGDNHKKFWTITMDELNAIVPADKFTPTKEKIDSFAAAFGTILYFEDKKTISSLQKSFPSYSDNFPNWAQQSNGMLQYMVWTALATKCIGASLQHYNPLVDSKVKKVFDIEDDWLLIAQMPFGQITTPPQSKDFLPLEQRLKVLK